VADLQQDGWNESASKRSLFEHLFVGSDASRRAQLTLQYRMVPSICRIVKKLSYEDMALEPAGIALERRHPFQREFACAVHWIRCKGPANRASRRVDTFASPENEAEAKAIVNCLQRFKSGLQEVDRPYEVGVISMYRGQVARLRAEIAHAGLFDIENLSIELGTVDAFQGRQKDAILLSLVETDPNRRAFFYDFRRVNVALSRARELLIVVGSLDQLGQARLSPFGDLNPLYLLFHIFDFASRSGDLKREAYCCQ
jgi:superfamily I DNA and/or RNA helicase